MNAGYEEVGLTSTCGTITRDWSRGTTSLMAGYHVNSLPFQRKIFGLRLTICFCDMDEAVVCLKMLHKFSALLGASS